MTQGSVGPEGSIEAEVIHKDGETEPVAVHPFVQLVNSVGAFFKGLFNS